MCNYWALLVNLASVSTCRKVRGKWEKLNNQTIPSFEAWSLKSQSFCELWAFRHTTVVNLWSWSCARLYIRTLWKLWHSGMFNKNGQTGHWTYSRFCFFYLLEKVVKRICNSGTFWILCFKLGTFENFKVCIWENWKTWNPGKIRKCCLLRVLNFLSKQFGVFWKHGKVWNLGVVLVNAVESCNFRQVKIDYCSIFDIQDFDVFEICGKWGKLNRA